MTDNTSATKSLPPVTVQPIKGGYRLTCPELGLTCTAPSLESGYDTLADLVIGTEQEGGVFIRDISVTDESAVPRETSTPRSTVRPTMMTRKAEKSSALFHLAIVALLLPIVLMSLSILNDIRAVVGSVRGFANSSMDIAENTPRLARSGSLGLTRLADTVDKLTPERQEEMQINLQRISLKLAPIAQGLRPLVEALGLAEVRTDNSPTSGAATQMEQPKDARE